MVFTNGCYDILHRGHAELLTYIYRKYSTAFVVVALNTDASVRRVKGRLPFNTLDDRLYMMASMLLVNYVTWFDEDNPLKLIKLLKPDILVKGGDYTDQVIVGAEYVMEHGGTVDCKCPLIMNGKHKYSSTDIAKRTTHGRRR